MEVEARRVEDERGCPGRGVEIGAVVRGVPLIIIGLMRVASRMRCFRSSQDSFTYTQNMYYRSGHSQILDGGVLGSDNSFYID